ncbi:unnamed protein product, partial [Polarella glacialis]|eukprot:CAMPEP_0115066706 /NCGR_PEP_ID=MMETSP0227-20121206/10963_1 /TAXON_ID=89957 /ORGANISM="Polarella glacialis, Strain CCMP 1383" /LENGTH=587 /DNA_ID=CAMNT_0002452651 /DNA_START=46 /DNA_END=1809 /DNA_ORIENTATION=+
MALPPSMGSDTDDTFKPPSRQAPLDQDVVAAVAAFKKGEYVVVADGQGSCSLVLPAQHATPARIAFLLRNSSGVLCAAMERERLEAFGLHPRSRGRSSSRYMAVDWAPGCSTGVSAKDRCATLRALCDSSSSAASFVEPGHISPVCVSREGILGSAGKSEAAFDLCVLAGMQPVAVLAEMMREDGEQTTGSDAIGFSREHGVPLLTVEQLLAHRRSQVVDGPVDGTVSQAKSRMWVDDIKAECTMHVYSTSDPKVEIVAVVKGDMKGAEAVPTRIHSECFTGDILGSKRCDCGQQLHRFMKIMDAEPCGVLLYVRGHEGRGIGLANKIRAYKLQDEGHDTVDANLKLGLPVDTRTYEDALGVLLNLGLLSIRLFTNNPEKMRSLQRITKEVVALASTPCEHNAAYLNTKRNRLNHRTVLETFKLPELCQVTVSNLKVGIVHTTWNQYYVDELLGTSDSELKRSGASTVKMSVPGCCELISGARAMLRHHKPDAVIVIGVLLKGSSDLYEAMCNSVMTGLTELNASQDTPIILGLLMCQDEDQAHERSHGANNPAKAWAVTALHMASIAQGDSLPSVPPPPDPYPTQK